jgi:hypothetical protein
MTTHFTFSQSKNTNQNVPQSAHQCQTHSLIKENPFITNKPKDTMDFAGVKKYKQQVITLTELLSVAILKIDKDNEKEEF